MTNGVNLVGTNYQGKLQNSGDRITLLNNSGATVDEVTYSDGGRWGQWADGRRQQPGENRPAQPWTACRKLGDSDNQLQFLDRTQLHGNS